MRMNRKGFTLVELLIVVVIIAILAALILPRFFSQTEAPYLAEAQQMLGALRRSQLRTLDLGATAFQTITSCPVGGACTATEWQNIGMTILDRKTDGPWNYACDTTGNCTATRANGGTRTGNKITMMINGTYDCHTGSTGTPTYGQKSPNSMGCTA